MTVYGIDVSHHQGDNIDWPAVFADGIRFAILKVTEGTSYNWQAWLFSNARAAAAAGVFVGGYGFLHDADGNAQGDYYADRAQAAGMAGGGHAADTETAPGPDYPTAAETGAFCTRVRGRLTRPVGAYSGYWYWSGILGNPAMPAQVAWYWDSRYVANSTVRPWRTIVAEVPPSWFSDTRTGGRAPDIIQVNSNAQVAGIAGGVDLNVFPGSLDELRALFTGAGGDWFDMATQADLAQVIDDRLDAKFPGAGGLTDVVARRAMVYVRDQAGLAKAGQVSAVGGSIDAVTARVAAVQQAVSAQADDEQVVLAAIAADTTTVNLSEEQVAELAAAFPSVDPQKIAQAVRADVAAALQE